jgi:hypothetical protein
MYPELLLKLPNMKFHENPFSDFRIIRGRTDRRGETARFEPSGSHSS